ncbi:MAG: M23 family metallopeptidase, partial [Oscillospiraceae bacterium]|nr:M23 family metallopeptidase [Oscillospiraceae bacterium]
IIVGVAMIIMAIVALSFIAVLVVLPALSNAASMAVAQTLAYAMTTYTAEDDDIRKAHSYFRSQIEPQIRNLESGELENHRYFVNGSQVNRDELFFGYAIDPYLPISYISAWYFVHEELSFVYNPILYRSRTQALQRLINGFIADVFEFSRVVNESGEVEINVNIADIEAHITRKYDGDEGEAMLVLFSVYMESRGNKPYLFSPLSEPIENWRSYVTSEFGVRPNPEDKTQNEQHNGIDIRRPTGTDIMAAADGVVLKVVRSTAKTGYGTYVVIDHGGGFLTLYAHCSAAFVEELQDVQRGEIIAAVGNTGRSTGAHLHFEVRVDGIQVNPRLFLP